MRPSLCEVIASHSALQQSSTAHVCCSLRRMADHLFSFPLLCAGNAAEAKARAALPGGGTPQGGGQSTRHLERSKRRSFSVPMRLILSSISLHFGVILRLAMYLATVALYATRRACYSCVLENLGIRSAFDCAHRDMKHPRLVILAGVQEEHGAGCARGVCG